MTVLLSSRLSPTPPSPAATAARAEVSGDAPPRPDATFGAAPIGPESNGGEGPRDGRFSWVLSTYFAEGLPYSLVHQVAPQFFTAIGSSLSTIGLTSLYGLAWNIKFLWSPLVDRFGSTRRWLVVCQLALAASVAAVGWSAGAGAASTVATLLVLVSLLAATNDVATDGYYMAALGGHDQVTFAGHRIIAYRIALWVGQGGLVALAGLTSFRLSFLIAALMLGVLGLLHERLLPRPHVLEASLRAPGLGFVPAVGTFFAKKRVASTIAFLLLFRAGDALMFAMSSPFLSSLGLDTARRGIVQGILGSSVSIVGTVAGLRYIKRRGLAATLGPIALLQSIAILLYVPLAAARPGFVLVVAAVLVEQLIAGIGTAAFTIFILQRSAGEFKAAHFAFCTALMSVATSVIGAPSGFLASAVGYPVFFALAFAASIPGVLLARYVPQEPLR